MSADDLIAELLPCPFCGGTAEFERMGTIRASTIVNCTECGCILESGAVFRPEQDWNRRAALPAFAQPATTIASLMEENDRLVKEREVLEREYLAEVDRRRTSEAANEALLAALEPFANAIGAEKSDPDDASRPDSWEIWEMSEAMNITLGDLRRARALTMKGDQP